MRISLVLTLGLAAILTSGCYESGSDLIGTNATEILGVDSVIAFRNSPYFVVSSGLESIVCPLTKLSSAGKPCSNPMKIKIERIVGGNYIVQFQNSGKYYFGLWYRDTSSSFVNDCLMILGEDLVGTNLAAAIVSSASGRRPRPSSRFDRLPRFVQLRSALEAYPNERLNSRDELSRIVDIYSQTVYSLADPVCLGDKLHFGDSRAVRIDGDNRNLPPYE